MRPGQVSGVGRRHLSQEICRENPPRPRRFEIRNSGLLIFLYDEANAAAIRAANPAVLSGYGRKEAAKDEALQQLAAQGLLVAYELVQDGDRVVEVAVGPPLSAREKQRTAWLPAQRALLSLPSGKLRIEPYDYFRLSPDWDLWVRDHRERYRTEMEYHGAMLKVPPGRYLLTLHRVNWDVLDGRGEADQAAKAGVPSEVVTLTPRASRRPFRMAVPLLLSPIHGPRTRRRTKR